VAIPLLAAAVRATLHRAAAAVVAVHMEAVAVRMEAAVAAAPMAEAEDTKAHLQQGQTVGASTQSAAAPAFLRGPSV
jgi:hypothetical protein